MKELVLLTTSYPFGEYKESFLEIELQFLVKKFDKIRIVATNAESNFKRDLPSSVEVYRFPNNMLVGRSVLILLKYFQTIIRYMIPELNSVLKSGDGMIYKRFKSMLSHLIKAFMIRDYLLGKILTGSSNYLIYSYWFNGAALAAGLVKKVKPEIHAVSRLHGWDLYEDKYEYNYFPFQRLKSHLLDYCYFISDHGKRYFEERYGTSVKNAVMKLGVFEGNKEFSEEISTSFHIVSCSFLTRSKRIDLIIKSLALIDDINIRWTHLGGGEMLTELNSLSKALLGKKSNISYFISGNITNSEVRNFYSKNFIHLFIHPSENEGLPVSIMEAMSFGIPVIATDVGGTSEIVDQKSGMLLEKDTTPEKIKNSIIKIHSDYNNFPFRENAFQNWQGNFNANINYRVFRETLLKLISK
jgi:glycosyltransferase involved in cell wall biosynthesis